MKDDALRNAARLTTVTHHLQAALDLVRSAMFNLCDEDNSRNIRIVVTPELARAIEADRAAIATVLGAGCVSPIVRAYDAAVKAARQESEATP